MAKLNEIYSVINSAFPFSEAEEWDNSGLLVENDKEIKRVIVSLDASICVINEAIEKKADAVISHHPVIFHPISRLSLSDPAVLALKNSIGIISAHTNYDVGYLSADSEFSKLLAEAIGFREEGILDITHTEPHPHGFGRFGWLSKPLYARELAAALKEVLGADCLRYTGEDKTIFKIAFCCGGGSEYLRKVMDMGYDAYITSDVKHSAFIDANNNNFSLFVPTHYQMEKPAMKNLAELLQKSFPDVEFILSQSETEPSFVI